MLASATMLGRATAASDVIFSLSAGVGDPATGPDGVDALIEAPYVTVSTTVIGHQLRVLLTRVSRRKRGRTSGRA
jgi:hypothetical protein